MHPSLDQDFIARVRDIPQTDAFAADVAGFEGVQSSSLLSARARAFLAQLIALAKPQSVLEIGTYFAGTSEIMARALTASGQGRLITIDPEDSRADICEAKIAQWPADMRDLTAFIRLGSKDLFDGLSANAELRFGLCFVDGDHSHAGALTDLIGCARYADDNCVIVVDDFDQPQVSQAARDFLRLHPDWAEIGGAFGNQVSGEQVSGDPFSAMRPSLPDLPFLILIGPAKAGLSARPQTFLLRNMSGTGVTALELATTGDHGGGTLYAKFIFDSVNPLGVEALRHTVHIDIPAHLEDPAFRFDPPLRTPGAETATSNTCEVSLIWRGDGDPLPLVGAPVWRLAD